MSHEDTDEAAQYHLEVEPGDVAPTVLLPGDPARVDTITAGFDEANEIASHREYRTVTGSADGVPVSVTSTGIGSPSAAIAVEELARVGAETLVRVGSCGAIHPDIDIGDLVITTAAVRQEGTSDEYVRSDYPATASHEVVLALIGAAEQLGHPYHVGVTASTDSFYAGQGRPGYHGFEAAGANDRLDELQSVGVLNFEMEASAILTLSAIYGLRAGAVCTVYANRVTDEFTVMDDSNAAETATLAATILAEMDAQAAQADAAHWYPHLDP